MRFAVAGLATAYPEELNIKVLTGYGVILIVVAWLRGVAWPRIGIVSLLLLAMLSAELINSAIERVCNLINGKKDPEIRKIKDISSAAVFLAGLSLNGFWVYAVFVP